MNLRSISLNSTIIKLAEKQDKLLKVDIQYVADTEQCSYFEASNKIDNVCKNLLNEYVYLEDKFCAKTYNTTHIFVHKSIFELPFFIILNHLDFQSNI